MNTNLQQEFEDYVRRLTSEICTGIFLKDLQELFQGYQENLQNARDIGQNLHENVDALAAGVQQAGRIAQEVETQSEQSLKEISNDLLSVRQHTESLFREMERLNEDDRNALVNALNDFSLQYQREISQILQDNCLRMEKIADEMVTAERLKAFEETLEAYAQKSRELAGFINGAYLEEAEKSIRALAEKNRRSQEALGAALAAQIAGTESRFAGMGGTISETMQKRSEEFAALQDGVRQQLLTDLDDFSGKYRESLAAVLQDTCRKIARATGAMVTEERLKAFEVSVKQYTQESRTLVGMIQHTYQEEVRKNLLALEERSLREQQAVSLEADHAADRFSMVDNQISETMHQRTGEFFAAAARAEKEFSNTLEEFQQMQNAAWAAAVEQQTELIRRITPNEQQVTQIIDSTKKALACLEEEREQLLRTNRDLETIERDLRKCEDNMYQTGRKVQDATDAVWELKKIIAEYRAEQTAETQAMRKELHADRIVSRLLLLFSGLMNLSLFVLLVSPQIFSGLRRYPYWAAGAFGVFAAGALLCQLVGTLAAKLRKKP